MKRKYSIVHFGPPDLTQRQYFSRTQRGKTLFVKGAFDGPFPRLPGEKYPVRLFPGPKSARNMLAKVARDLGFKHLHGDFYGKGEQRLTLYFDRLAPTRSNPVKHGIAKLNGAQVRMLFKADWHTVVKYAPDLANDLPAKREHFANYVDMLHRDGRISDRTAQSVTMPGEGRKGKRVLSNPHKAGSANKVEARELLLFAENDGDLYRMQVGPIQKNLTKKFKAGKYSSTKAAKLWTYLADNAAKKYTFEHGDRGAARSWHQVKGYGIFTAATRRLVGRLLEKSWHAEMKAGNFHV